MKADWPSIACLFIGQIPLTFVLCSIGIPPGVWVVGVGMVYAMVWHAKWPLFKRID